MDGRAELFPARSSTMPQEAAHRDHQREQLSRAMNIDASRSARSSRAADADRESISRCRRRCACRGCRWARRPVIREDRPRGLARWRTADVRRPKGSSTADDPFEAPSPTRSKAIHEARSSIFFSASRAGAAGMDTFSLQLRVGSRLKNWKMKPILSRRMRVRSSSGSPLSGFASTGSRSCPSWEYPGRR